jgi:hypothetical protein
MDCVRTTYPTNVFGSCDFQTARSGARTPPAQLARSDQGSKQDGEGTDADHDQYEWLTMFLFRSMEARGRR